MDPSVTGIVNKYSSEWQTLRQQVEQALPTCTNSTRRVLHAKVELLRMKFEEASGIVNTGDEVPPNGPAGDFIAELEAVSKSLKLNTRFSQPWWYMFEVIFRFAGVVMGIVTLGLILPLPIVMLRFLDTALLKIGVLSPFTLSSEMLKRWLSQTLLVLSGISIEVQGLDRSLFEENCVILTFSHSSNLDGFLVSGTCPVRHFALAKKELFCVPFFSWLSLAIGGVPVDRENRDRAVRALGRTADSAKDSKVCVVVAPEGTRSTTGQLRPFKKGTFYTWEGLHAPIVPFVTFGGFDLYPVGTWVNRTGKIYVRYLQPILPNEATSRDKMNYLLRRRMLESMLDPPADIAAPLSWSDRLLNVLATLAVFVFDWFAVRYLHDLVFVRLGFSGAAVALYVSVGSIFITVVLYVYSVYVVDFMSAGKDKKQ